MAIRQIAVCLIDAMMAMIDLVACTVDISLGVVDLVFHRIKFPLLCLDLLVDLIDCCRKAVVCAAVFCAGEQILHAADIRQDEPHAQELDRVLVKATDTLALSAGKIILQLLKFGL